MRAPMLFFQNSYDITSSFCYNFSKRQVNIYIYKNKWYYYRYNKHIPIELSAEGGFHMSKSCQKCGAILSDEAQFCNRCGQKAKDWITCKCCGAHVPNGIKFCTQCGAPVSDGNQQDFGANDLGAVFKIVHHRFGRIRRADGLLERLSLA